MTETLVVAVFIMSIFAIIAIDKNERSHESKSYDSPFDAFAECRCFMMICSEYKTKKQEDI